KITAQMAQNLFPSESGGLYVLSDSQNLLENVAAWGNAPVTQNLFALDDCWALRRGRVHTVESPSVGPLCRHLGTPSAPSRHLCIPLMAQGQAHGVLYLQSSLSKSGTSGLVYTDPLPSRQRLAVTMAEQVSLAVSNLRLQNTLRSQATR